MPDFRSKRLYFTEIWKILSGRRWTAFFQPIHIREAVYLTINSKMYLALK
jgi:hypothetical protein